MYDLKFIDVTDDIDRTNRINAFSKVNLKEFWKWNYLDAVHYNWDVYSASNFRHGTHSIDRTLINLERVILGKDSTYIREYGTDGPVGPLHFKIQKDGQDAFISFGYMKYPGVYEQYFNFFIPVPYDDKQMLWTYSIEHERGLGNFLEGIGRPVHTILGTAPKKSPIMRWIRRRKALTITSIVDNPDVDNSVFLTIDCNWNVSE